MADNDNNEAVEEAGVEVTKTVSDLEAANDAATPLVESVAVPAPAAPNGLKRSHFLLASVSCNLSAIFFVIISIASIGGETAMSEEILLWQPVNGAIVAFLLAILTGVSAFVTMFIESQRYPIKPTGGKLYCLWASLVFFTAEIMYGMFMILMAYEPRIRANLVFIFLALEVIAWVLVFIYQEACRAASGCIR